MTTGERAQQRREFIADVVKAVKRELMPEIVRAVREEMRMELLLSGFGRVPEYWFLDDDRSRFGERLRIVADEIDPPQQKEARRWPARTRKRNM